MTLIIKELIIRGNIVKDDKEADQIIFSNKDILKQLDDMKMSIKKECIEAILSKLEAKSSR